MLTATKAGDRVRLVACFDPYTQIPSGTLGTVRFVDSMGTVHVVWDDGCSLGLIPDEDDWVVVRS